MHFLSNYTDSDRTTANTWQGVRTSAELHSHAAAKQGWSEGHLLSLAVLHQGKAPPRAWVSTRSSRAVCTWAKAAWLGGHMLSQSLGLPGQRSQHNIQPSVGLGGLGAIPFLRRHARIVACFGRNVWRPWVVSRSRTFLCHHTSGYGLVAMTFASHVKGREFDPHYPYLLPANMKYAQGDGRFPCPGHATR